MVTQRRQSIVVMLLGGIALFLGLSFWNFRTQFAEKPKLKKSLGKSQSPNIKKPARNPDDLVDDEKFEREPVMIANNHRDLEVNDAPDEEEVIRHLKKPIELKLSNGRVKFNGTIEESGEERYKGKKSFQILTIELAEGKSYRIDHTSKEMQAFLHLEDPDGNVVAENSSPAMGGNSRINYQADRAGIYRIIATSLAGFRTGTFTCSVRVVNPGLIAQLPNGLPSWFSDLDTDGDGQIGLYEWQEQGKSLNEFHTYDLNNDGFITPDEILRHVKMPIDLKLQNGQVSFNGQIEEMVEQLYRGKKSFKILTIQFEAGKTYQIDHMSADMQAFLHLEDSEGNLLSENSSDAIGGNSRIVYRAGKTGVYRLIATSLAGHRTGEFTCSVRLIRKIGGILSTELPRWFHELDKHENGQITAFEWRESGRQLADFQAYDLDGDGLITAEEVVRQLKRPIELKLQNGRASFHGTIEELAEERYKGKKSFRTLTVAFEEGKTYQLDHMSNELQACMHLEDSDGNPLKENCSPAIGGNSRIIYRAERSGTYRIIATSLSGRRTGAFVCSVRAVHRFGGVLATDLPRWFTDIDKEENGQITSHEWRASGRQLAEFQAYDVDGDGFITAEEVLRQMKRPIELKFQNGRSHFNGTIDESTEDRYRGKKSFRVLTVPFETGRAYQIEHTSGVLQAYLHLEDPDGNLLKESSSDAIGGRAQIIYRAEKGGIYRIIATSPSGNRSGAFSCSVRVIRSFGGVLATQLPKWFNDIDKDENGQITALEWRKSGRQLAEFNDYDLDGDGLVTAEEVVRQMRRPIEISLKNGRAIFNGLIEETTEERYRGKKSFKILTVSFEEGKTYQIEHRSSVLQAFLHLEDSEGNVLKENSSAAIGGNSRIIYHAEKSGSYRIIATSPSGNRSGAFTFSVHVVRRFGGILATELPVWFTELDKDENGQITPFEWRRSGRKFDEFNQFDLDGDGVITAEEVFRHLKRPIELKLQNGRANFNGTIEEAEERYRGKKSYRVLSIQFEAGKTYQIDHMSSVMQAFLHLEGPDGNLLMEHSSADIGGSSQIVFRAEHSGTYRIVATSLAGYRTGAFSCSVQVVSTAVDISKGMPKWFKEFDKDQDGQVDLYEWRLGGKKLDEFRVYDLDGDGFITAEEIKRFLNKSTGSKR